MKVICNETGKVYNSASEAADDVGLYDGTGIGKCCRGKAKSAGGFTWSYADDSTSQKSVTVDEDEDDSQCCCGGCDCDDDCCCGDDDTRTVADIMCSNPVSLYIDSTVAEAVFTMEAGKFLRLPIVNKANQVVGIITKYDVNRKIEEKKAAGANVFNPSEPILNYMVRNTLMVTKDAPIDKVRELGEEQNAKFLPVIESETDPTLVGIVTLYMYYDAE